MIRPLGMLLLAAVTAFALSGCGKEGELERGAPLFGAKRAQYEADQRAAAAKARENENATGPGAQAPGQAAPAVEPPRSAPMPGAKSDPNPSAPQGVLPDPYARPQ
jgi:hypothetical protein